MSGQKSGACKDVPFAAFSSRRSVVYGTKGMVACTQPLAACAGQRVLSAGGNAADAAVAVAAALSVTEPQSTGLGGDMFCLFYCSTTKTIKAINGSGRSSLAGKQEDIIEAVLDTGNRYDELGANVPPPSMIPMSSVHSVTVPGTAAGWLDTLATFGTDMPLVDVLGPAIDLAENGFPVSEITSMSWQEGEWYLRQASPSTAQELLKPDAEACYGSRAPQPGEIIRNVFLARTLRKLACEGKKGFYTGSIAEAIVEAVRVRGGYLRMEDLQYHLEHGSEQTTPISLTYNLPVRGYNHVVAKQSESKAGMGVEVWEHAPNGQGLVALIALGVIQELQKSGRIQNLSAEDHNTVAYLHVAIEALRIAFADGIWHIAHDEDRAMTEHLLSAEYLATRARLFNPGQASKAFAHGDLPTKPTSSSQCESSPPMSWAGNSPAFQRSDTVYLAVTDAQGNACSFINSNFGKFGSGIIPDETGFVLQNRAAGFVLDNAAHPNSYAPGKRPYHTIIPSITTNVADNSLHSVFGVMGGFMQPQGHVQVFMNMHVFGLNPQAALDAPRFCIGAGTPDEGKLLDRIFLEEGMADDVVQGLCGLGHSVELVGGLHDRALFGRGQVISVHRDAGCQVYAAGSDPRGDGAAFPV